ncbi:MAG: aminotransferase class III-fold pyridoxal phosphate-dependent enzyme [Candidatus Brocadiia bacterium]
MDLRHKFADSFNLNEPSILVPPPGPKAQQLVSREDKIASPAHGRGYPLVVDHAFGIWIMDPDGNRFMDFTSGIGVTNAGHCHPDIVEALTAQVNKFFHYCGPDFYYEQQTIASEMVVSVAPVDNAVPFFTNSGAEATEAAMKLARYYTKRPRFMALRGAFHGRTLGALSLTSSKSVQRARYAPLIPEVTHVANPYCYRCPINLTYPACKVACVDLVEDNFKTINPAEEVAAFFAEPIQGEGGYIVPPPEYFPKLAALLKKYDVLLAIDEVQAGNGRSGKMFAIEHWGVRPDILYTAKGLGSGFPIGVMVSRRELNTWPAGSHSNTYGGNPMGTVVVAKTLELIQNGLMQNAAARGEELFAGLKGLQKKYDFIGDVRGMGLMRAIEIVKNFDTKERDPQRRDRIVQKCFENGLLVYFCGPNSVRFIPPLIITKAQIAGALAVLDKVLKAV